MSGAKRKPRVVVPSREQLEATIMWLHPPLQTFATVAAWSGLRLFEVAALEPRDVKDAAGGVRLHVRHGKGDRERVSTLLAPGVPAMEEALSLATLRGPKRPWIWRTAQRNQWDRKSVNKHWLTARARTGIDVGFHVATRHFHATYLINEGAAYSDVAVQLGHFDWDRRPNIELVRSVYGHLDHDKALDRLDGIGGAS